MPDMVVGNATKGGGQKFGGMSPEERKLREMFVNGDISPEEYKKKMISLGAKDAS